jgi:glyoxylase-like metal-dependent hydrolase (beta-lactamase superfamily II)
MGHGRLLIVPALLLSAAAGAIEITGLQEGAWAALQPPENRFNDCNSLIVEANEFVIIVDAQESRADVETIIDFVQNKIGKPVGYLINTHWHGDHTQGNSLYAETYGEALTIIGHATLLHDIPERAAAHHAERIEELTAQLPAARAQLESGTKLDGNKFTDEELKAQTARVARAEAWLVANANVIFTVPTESIDKPYSVEAGRASFTLYPERGHTRGDLLAWFPRLGVLASGDLVDEMPYSGHGYPGEWLAALGFIESLDFDVIVPGHGPVLHDRVLIGKLKSYFESLTGQVESLLANGKNLEQIRAETDLGSSRRSLAGDDPAAMRFFDAVQDEAIARAYAELVGDE